MHSEDIYQDIIPFDASIHPRSEEYPGVRVSDTESFLTKAMWIHGSDRFDFSDVTYKKAKQKIKFKCNLCGAVLNSTPQNLLNNRASCKYCNGGVALDGVEYIHRLQTKYPNLDFSESVYHGSRIKMSVKCRIHGEFFITPSRLTGKDCLVGCYKCGSEVAGKSIRLGFDEVLKRAKSAHGGKYDYSAFNEIEYTSIYQKVPITCPTHGTFIKSINDHIQGKGCRECQPKGWKGDSYFEKYPDEKEVPACLYVVKMHDPEHSETFVKIGISKQFETRRRQFERNGLIIDTHYLKEDTYFNCFMLEQTIKNEFYRYRFVPSLRFGGFSECFELDKVHEITERVK